MSEEIITAGRFKDDPEFNALEKAAYCSAKDGRQFDLGSLSANEYKYFSKLIQIYQDFENKLINLADAEKKKTAIYSEYKKSTNEHLSRIIDNLKWRDNIRTSETIRLKINKSTDINEIATLALECIGLMTGDETFLKSNIGKIIKL